MDIASILFWAVVVGLVIYVVSIYNHLVRIKHSVSKAWSNIDVLLKQRHDEIPKLVETCKQYMKFEQETLEKVALPGEKPASQPYIISATLEEDLVTRKKLKAYSAVAAGFLVFSTLVGMLSIRASLSV